MTFEQIGAVLGVSRHEARRIYIGAIIKMREHLRKRPAQAEEILVLIETDNNMAPRGATAASRYGTIVEHGFENENRWSSENE